MKNIPEQDLKGNIMISSHISLELRYEKEI